MMNAGKRFFLHVTGYVRISRDYCGTMDNTLTRYLLWWKQSKEFELDSSNEDATSEFGFPIKAPIESHKRTLVRKMFRKAVKEVLVEEGLSGYYADNYRCWPPPLFLISITIVQVCPYCPHCWWLAPS